MTRKTEEAANFAIWQMQYSTERAIRYITRRAGVSDSQAQEAIQRVTLWYRGQ
jgi:hypothetical protein